MPGWKRRLKEASKRGLRRAFELGQRFGFDVLPRHFYSEIPDIRALRLSSDWKAPYNMLGVRGVEIAGQLAFVKECCPPEIVEQLRAQNIQDRAAERNGEAGYGRVEADLLYAVVAARKPAQIVQIGCGVSTAICQMAAEAAGHTPEIICVEPYPTPFLEREAEQGRVKLIREKAQALDPRVIEDLSQDLLFFVDSSHTLGPAGEVSRIILEMLPRLKPGALVHFHDILFPYDYDRHLLDSALFFQHESVLLHAFLAYNPRFRILASLSMLHYADPEALRTCLPNYEPAGNDEGLNRGPGHFPSATYLEVNG